MNTQRNNKSRGLRALKLLGYFLLFVIVLAVIAIVLALNWYNGVVYEKAPSIAQTFIVPEGTTLLELADTLQEKGLINSELALRIYLRLEGTSFDLKAGSYTINDPVNLPELMDIFKGGPEKSVIRLTLQEGTRFDEMATRIDAAFEGIDDKRFDKADYIEIATNPDNYEFGSTAQAFINSYKPAGKSLEGFLFPDTYNVGVDASAKDIIELQISNLSQRLSSNNLSPTGQTRLDNFYEVLILASITEREANNLEDKKLVADIFLRRLERNEPLGADAPILYAFKNWQHALTISQIQDRSNPYNLRALTGLSPTPIANPSINAIKAVYEPTPNNYNFFLSAGGINYYTVSYSDHLANVRKYL